jgi:hypothetical protein
MDRSITFESSRDQKLFHKGDIPYNSSRATTFSLLDLTLNNLDQSSRDCCRQLKSIIDEAYQIELSLPSMYDYELSG